PALALLAELQYARASGSEEFRDSRLAWIAGLMSLRIPRRGFRASPTSIDESPFVDGEAWLTLAQYSRLHPADQNVREALPDLERYLMRRYADDVTTGFYQWGTMAAAVRLQATGDTRFAEFVRNQ